MKDNYHIKNYMYIYINKFQQYENSICNHFSFVFINCYSQNTINYVDTNIYLIVEDMPEFPGGEKALKEFIKSNSKYPIAEKTNVSTKRVFVYFVINVEGAFEKVEIRRSVNAELDEEAIRIIKYMPKWKPGMQRGNPVKVAYIVPINFAIDENKKK